MYRFFPKSFKIFTCNFFTILLQKNIIKNSVEKLLNLEIRVQEKSKDISRGDTSPFLISLLGTRNTFNKFRKNIICGGKIIFYIDENCKGCMKAISEFMDNSFFTLYKSNFVIFTKK